MNDYENIEHEIDFVGQEDIGEYQYQQTTCIIKCT